MSVLGYVYISLLSLFLSQVHLVSCQANDTAIISNPLEKGVGPEIFPDTHPEATPHINGASAAHPGQSYYWISDFKLKSGPVSVFIPTSTNPVYVISQDPEHDRGMIIRDSSNKTMLIAEDRKRAHCGFQYTYHAWNTTKNLSYKIDPRGAGTDRWYMRVGDKNTETSFTFYRGATKDKGPVKYSNGTKAAQFDLRKNPVTNGTDPFSGRTIVYLTVYDDVDVEPSYLVGLWTMAKKRKRRCTS